MKFPKHALNYQKVSLVTLIVAIKIHQFKFPAIEGLSYQRMTSKLRAKFKFSNFHCRLKNVFIRISLKGTCFN